MKRNSDLIINKSTAEQPVTPNRFPNMQHSGAAENIKRLATLPFSSSSCHIHCIHSAVTIRPAA
jgi:hypothetical protein